MKRSVFAIAAVMLLASCVTDEQTKATNDYVGGCVSQGAPQEFCSCRGAAMKKRLSEAEYQEISLIMNQDGDVQEDEDSGEKKFMQEKYAMDPVRITELLYDLQDCDDGWEEN